MKYLITGASGFIGSFLVELLLQKKHDICACGQKFGSIFKIHQQTGPKILNLSVLILPHDFNLFKISNF